MTFLSEDIGHEIMGEIEDAHTVDIASAYFSPGDDQVSVLQEVPELRIYVSEDFTASDPFSLESLATDAEVKCIPPSSDGGRFHAKVVLCRREDGSKAVFVGSANFTGPGLFSNHETCTKIDTRDGDESTVKDVERWINGLESLGRVPDWEKAQRRYKSKKAVAPMSGSQRDTNYWILKTRSGKALRNPYQEDKADYWDDFRSESVVAIGWTELRFNPLGRSRDEIRRELEAVGRKTSSAHFIDKFVNGITEGDLILLCRGYAPEGSAATSEEVLFYGYARVEGDFYYDEDSPWWYMKYPATIQEEEAWLPREIFQKAFDKKSLRGTIHKKGITEERFYNFCDRVRGEYGIPLHL